MNQALLSPLVRLARHVTKGWIYRKTLPAALGSGQVYVTPRSDIRLLAPGLKQSAADLFLVAHQYIQPGHKVWDIGSNLGLFAFAAAWKCGPAGKVHTLEADPFYAELQNRTARQLPRGYAQVIPLCAAAANKPCLLNLAIPKKGQSRNHLAIVEGNAAGETECHKQVACLTADFLLEHWPAPDFVKVDIEGAEILFLEGATKLLKVRRPVFYLEISDPHQDAATSILHGAGYALYAMEKNGKEIPISRCNFNTLAKPRV